MDERDGLLLTTAYETMSSLERFWFPNPNLRLRTSTVEGLSNTASFCMESRCLPIDGEGETNDSDDGATVVSEPPRRPLVSAFGW
jgi:hypothetical protein